MTACPEREREREREREMERERESTLLLRDIQCLSRG